MVDGRWPKYWKDQMLHFNLSNVKNYIGSLPLNISARPRRPFVGMIRQIFKSFAIFICTPLAGIFWILKIKFPDIWIQRIGHLMLEADCFVKEQLLNEGPTLRAVMLVPAGKSANHAAVRYWSKYFIVFENPILVSFLKPFQHHPWTKFNTRKYVSSGQTADIYRIYNNWGIRPPLLKLEQCDVERGDEVLKLMGVPEGAWYVCLHAREGGYSVYDEHFHKHRNISITNFDKAIAYIVSQGGWCIRMGDTSMSPAPNILGLIDYALSAYKQDWMDLFLAARCKFFLGSNSGAQSMAMAFGTASALAGMAPLSVMAVGRNDICIPMLYKSDEVGRTLTFNEILQSKAASYKLAEEYEKARISLEHNTPEDILDLTIEIFQRVEGTYIVEIDDELRQGKFKSMLKPGHYSYGTASRIGNAFLKKHKYLLN